MSNIQSFLSIGAITLMSLISLRFNEAVLQNSSIEIENKVYLTAFSLADDLIEEIKEKAFDATTVFFPTTDPLTLTPPSDLGPDAIDTYPDFDDVDDFNGYSRTISAPHAEDYDINCTVWYVDPVNQNQFSSVQTFYKRVEVQVASPYMKSPISLSFIFTLK
jgi:hypothetical protein